MAARDHRQPTGDAALEPPRTDARLVMAFETAGRHRGSRVVSRTLAVADNVPRDTVYGHTARGTAGAWCTLRGAWYAGTLASVTATNQGTSTLMRAASAR